MDANKKIGDYVASLDYSNDAFKEDICPPLISWLKEAGYSKEDVGIIVTTAGDIADDVIESMFNPNMEMLTDKADLLKHLNQEQYETLEQLIQINRKKASNVRYNLGEDEFLEVNFLNWIVKNVKTYLKKDGSIGTIEDILIDAAPSELIVYDNDILDEGRRFKITWKSKFSSREFVTQGETGSATIKEIGAILVNSGYCPQSKHITDTLSLMINAMIKNNLAIIKDTIDNKGVYYFNGKMQIVGLDTSKPEIKDIKKALRTLDKLQAQYDDEEKTILATVLKWGACCIFSYVKKQIGADWMPHLYLNGTGQAGKTTMGKLASFFYGGYTEEMNIGGGSFNSEYRIGFQVSRDCCLTIVNEPKACFSKEETIETVKNSVELPVCRKVQGKVYPALSPVVYTSNGFVPDMDSLYRRLYIIEFTHNQRKMGEEKTEFENMFNVEKPTKSILQNLSVLGRLCLRSVMNHPNLLEEDWKDMAAHFVNYWYEKADMVIPEWIMRWSDEADVTAVDEEIIESVREIINRTINDARKFNSDYASYTEEATTSKDFLNMFWAMLNKRTFDWALPHSPQGKKLVFLTQGFKKLLKKEIPDLSTLKGISQLLNWDYKNLKVHGKTRRGILISCEDFLDFVYPTIEEIEETEE